MAVNPKYILCSVAFFFFENRAVYRIMWKNTVGRGRPQMAIWRMRMAFRIFKAIDITDREGEIYDVDNKQK